jgi:murein DD-endopeptidase MepM/ murein hydrolase activator NlpD
MNPTAPMRRLRLVTACLSLFALVAIGACSTDSGVRAPVEYGGGAVGHGASVPSGTYIVQRGDTIYSVARRFNVTVRSLIDANNLQPPFQLTSGQVLQLGAGKDYVVVAADTLLGVARKTGASFSTLARMNNLSPPYVLKVGQHLKLPVETAAAPPAAVSQVAAGPPSSRQDAPLAAPAAVTATPLAAPPVSTGKGTGYTALAERDAKPAQSPAPAPPASAPPASVPPAAVASEQAEPPPAAATPPPGAPAEQRVVALSPPPASVSPPGSRGFVWPVHGQVISEYGSTGKGQHNDGINIAVPRGTPVVAADDGVVAYAGNELRGFGNLLLIRHSDGWMTAYAHNDTLLVKRGQSVRRGQEIATVGDSGGVSQPQLHFEVRQGTRAVDPMSFLGGKVNPASSAGGATPG